MQSRLPPHAMPLALWLVAIPHVNYSIAAAPSAQCFLRSYSASHLPVLRHIKRLVSALAPGIMWHFNVSHPRESSQSIGAPMALAARNRSGKRTAAGRRLWRAIAWLSTEGAKRSQVPGQSVNAASCVALPLFVLVTGTADGSTARRQTSGLRSLRHAQRGPHADVDTPAPRRRRALRAHRRRRAA